MRSAPRSAIFTPFRRPVARGRHRDEGRSAGAFAMIARVSMSVEKLFFVCSIHRRPIQPHYVCNCGTLVFSPIEATRTNGHAARRHRLGGRILSRWQRDRSWVWPGLTRPPIIRFAMQVSDGEDDDFVRLDNVNYSVREPPQPKPPHAVAEGMPSVRTLGDTLSRRSHFIDEPPLEARRLGGVPCDRLIKLGGSRRQQPDIHGRLACLANVSSKSSASSSPRR